MIPASPLDKEYKLNKQKIFRKRPEFFVNVLRTTYVEGEYCQIKKKYLQEVKVNDR